MSDIALVYCTFPSQAEAERIAGIALDERLTACVNVLPPVVALYRWQGAVERGTETPALFKTAPALVERLRARITALHPYALPVIEAWPVAAGPAAADWIGAETG
ncbi:divalent-cation tolerance protein CutA [Sphingomonas sp. CJ20]